VSLLLSALLVAANPAPTAAPAAPAARAEISPIPAAMARMEGVWKGVFRRYDADGVLAETLPSEVHIRFPTDNPDTHYHQTNLLTLANGTVQKIDSFGRWDGKMLRFANARVDGWYMPLAEDASGLNSVLFMAFKDGSGLTVSEIVTLSPDGTRRFRAAQYLAGGKVVRRTLIDETRAAPSP
jgi:hypothetical protein